MAEPAYEPLVQQGTSRDLDNADSQYAATAATAKASMPGDASSTVSDYDATAASAKSAAAAPPPAAKAAPATSGPPPIPPGPPWSSATAVMSDLSGGTGGGAGGNAVAQATQLAQRYQQIQQAKENSPEVQAARKNYIERTKVDEETANRMQQHMEQLGVEDANALQPWDADKMQAKYTTSTMEKFGSTGVMFAMIAAAFTHQPMINALNGSAAAMNAITAGDEEKYNRAYDAWKSNMELVEKRHTMMMDTYKGIADLATKDPAMAEARMKAASAQFDDPAAAALAEQGMWGKAAELQQKREELFLRSKELEPQLELQNMKNQVYFGMIDDYRLKHGAQLVADKDGTTHIVGGPSLAQIPADVKTQAYAAVMSPQSMIASMGLEGMNLPSDAKQSDVRAWVYQNDPRAYMIANYQLPPPAGFGQNNPGMEKIYRDVMLANPNYSAPRYNEINKALTEFGPGKLGTGIKSFNVAIQHMDIAEKLAKALGNQDFVMGNRLQQDFAQAFGQPQPTEFNAARHFLATEVSRAITGSGNAGALADRQELEDSINNAQSWPQLSGALHVFKMFMAGQINGYRKQYQDATGLDNFDDRLFPETRAVVASASPWQMKPEWEAKFPAKNQKEGKLLTNSQGEILAVVRNGEWADPNG